MIQNPKRQILIGIFTLVIILILFFVPEGGQAEGLESTPPSEATPLPEPTSTPVSKQLVSQPQVQSLQSNGPQFGRGLDPTTLTVTYHDMSNLYFPILTEPWEQPIDFYISCWNEIYPFPSCKLIPELDNGRDWSLQWIGTLIVPESGEYTFSLPEHDDGVRVFLDNELVIDSGWNYPGLDFKGPDPQTVPLIAGQYDIRIDYEQRLEYVASVQLRWSGPNFEDEIIPIYTQAPTPTPTPTPTPILPPQYSTSLYWQSHDPQSKTLDKNRLYAFGCSEAKKRNGDIVVVLFFGDPIIYGGQYYTRLPSSATWIKLENIEAGVQSYISGYWDCSDGAPLWSEHLTLAVGVTNAGEALNTEGRPREAGEEWGRMINRLQDWVLYVPTYSYPSGTIPKVNYSSRVSVAGAINIEKWGGNATPQGAREWVEGYASTTSKPYYSVQSCEDCTLATHSLDTWGRDIYWYLAWGGVDNAWPLPMIYNQTLAERWQELSRYGATCQNCIPATYDNYGRMYFAGAFTEQLACDQTSDPCTGIDLSPEEGWQALYSTLYADPVTRMEFLNYSTDIGWDIYLDPSE